MDYELVLLDADGTLFDFDAAAAAAFAACGSESGIPDASLIFPRYLQINHGLWADLERGGIDKESLKSERFRRLFAEFSLTVDAASFSVRYLQLLATQAPLLEGAEGFVRTLKESGVRLAVVTNGVASVQRGRFSRSPLGALIPELMISEELGAEKPSRAFFSEAFRCLGRPATDTEGVVVVGDSWSADIEGALGFGLDAIWFNPARKGRPDGARPEVAEAASYGEVLALLGVASVWK
ncbi:MAG: noncanonical pyrimidine nucleotidase, YjjG family [Treponema sp. RIFOXYC1_FULL_61_9]|nr:MAG: noncanonical pyrimidine nucleotidase, YjjG family [Treponema sp. GWC1_61_84]OHE71158.1 MAG: noncanonical pyrimidine nucleotidase, YjjG family [Treponema sp. RIFOXYC1_FULL_61_9]